MKTHISTTTRFLWLAFACLALIVLAGVVVALRHPKPIVSGPLTLPDGSVVRIVAVTYGTNHVVGTPLARFVARLPAAMQFRLKGVLGPRAALFGSTTTTTPTLVVWLGRAATNTPAAITSGYLTALLSDASGFISGVNATISGWWSNPLPLRFPVFPRRDPVIALNFFYHKPRGGIARCGRLRFVNPQYRTYPQWQPEPLPATRKAGDVVVTLKKLSTGHGYNTECENGPHGTAFLTFDARHRDDENRSVCFIHFQPLTRTNEVWRVAQAVVSDATGNHIGSTSLGWGGYDQDYFTFDPGLWTNESAWKLRCEIKRAEGFAPGETFAFREVPLGRLDQTNRIGWMTNFNGVTVSLDYVLRRTPNTNNSWSSSELSQVQLSTTGLTNGVHLDLLSARSDAGTNLTCNSWNSGSDARTYYFRAIPLDAKAADFTFAVQHSRWVEFLVKPEVGPARLPYQPRRGR
jgi:hypothetical protein